MTRAGAAAAGGAYKKGLCEGGAAVKAARGITAAAAKTLFLSFKKAHVVRPKMMREKSKCGVPSGSSFLSAPTQNKF
jgi:hypothetical protein